MINNRVEKFFHQALEQMFQAVGFPGYDEKFTRQENWFQKKSWNNEAEASFRNWFITTSRKQLRWTKKQAEAEFSWFNLMWGWKREDIHPQPALK